MLHVELFSGIFEFVDPVFHFVQIRIDLGPVLVVHIDDVHKAFLEEESLFLYRVVSGSIHAVA